MAPTTATATELIEDPEVETEYFSSPLGRNWEREAAAQLIELLGLITTGHFETQNDFAQRLYQTANRIAFAAHTPA